MSFSPEFNDRWENVIKPAITSVAINGERMTAKRVDVRQISDSILTEILGHIGKSRMIFADISSIGQIEGRTIRNGNVMYEVGIAHAWRLPEEVLLFRSDDDPLPFDVANVRVNTYSPNTEPQAAREKLSQAIIDSLREIELKKHATVEAAARSLDPQAYWALGLALNSKGTVIQPRRTFGQVLANDAHNQALIRLLQIGAIKTEYPKISKELIEAKGDGTMEELFTFHISPFGKAIMDYICEKLGMLDPEFGKMIQSHMQQSSE